MNLILSLNLVSQKLLSCLIVFLYQEPNSNDSIRHVSMSPVSRLYINGGGNRMVRQVLRRRIGVGGRSKARMRWMAVVHGHPVPKRSCSNSVSVIRFSPDIVDHFISNDSLFVIFFFVVQCSFMCNIDNIFAAFYLCVLILITEVVSPPFHIDCLFAIFKS